MMDRLHCFIRAREPRDDVRLTLLAEEVFRPLALAGGHPERYDSSRFLDLLESAEVFVAHARAEGGQVAGFVALEDEGDGLAVRCLCVAPAYEAQGVAHQLLDWTEGLAYGRGRGKLLTTVAAGDERSLRLFRSHAWESLAGAPDRDACTLQKRLAELP
jgi:GNAT superfamily N-acetyltransferase